MDAAVAQRPAHVPPERVFDFDFYHPPGAEQDVHLAWKRLHEVAPDIFWTPRNGGHWVATRAEDIEEIQLDHERFSHRMHHIPFNRATADDPSLPLGVDPPDQAPYRALIAPAFLPRVVSAVEASVREVAIEAIEGFLPRGECEFVSEFARVLPIVVFLRMVDLPLADAPKLLALTDDIVRSGSLERRTAATRAVKDYLGRWVDERTLKPGSDLISQIATAEIEGRPITRKEALSVSQLLMGGGLDTVASMLGFIALFMARRPEHRRELIDHPERYRIAVEELIRRHGLPNTARMITHDFVYKGVQFRQGEQIQIPNSLFGLDERKVADPMEVDFGRPMPILHAAFGNGVHTCPGAVLARREIAVFLQEWLKRIPDFQIKPGTTPVTASGMVNTVRELHLSWPVG
ncbi:MAG: cytochrome P450 [Caulobacteraceae bacterium]|nr:cytochrome P450 [Caulobacteraceae bacterium]